MEAKKTPGEVFCPLHPTYPIQGVNLQNPEDPKLFCFTCVLEQKEMSVISNLKAFPEFIKATAARIAKEKDSIQLNEKSQESIKALARKGEKLERLYKHIEIEKNKVSEFFDSLAKEVNGIIEDKKKQHLEELDKQLANLTSNFDFFEKELMQIPNDAELSHRFPTQEILEKRFQGISDVSELIDFVKELCSCGFKQGKGSYSNNLQRLAEELERNPSPFYKPGEWNIVEFKKEITGKLDKFFDQVAHLQEPIDKFGEFKNIDSLIVKASEFSVLREWLPDDVSFNPTLLYRSSRDGKDPRVFHKICDGKRNTVSIVKALFVGGKEPCVIGGYLDAAWHSKDEWIKSDKAFLFSLTSKVKCAILIPEDAAFGHGVFGPIFGSGNSLRISLGNGSHVYAPSMAYERVSELVNVEFGVDGESFKEIEVEVFSLD